MITHTWPASLIPASARWGLQFNTQEFSSPLTRSVQTLEIAGARWACEFTLPPMTPAIWRTFSATVVKLRGRAGRLYFGPPHYRWSQSLAWTANASARRCDSTGVTCDSTAELINQEHRGPEDISLVVSGSDQTGASLTTSGWMGDQIALGAGDYISYDAGSGRQLHMVTEDAIADGGGRVVITIEPPIRRSPFDGAPVEIQSPTCIMALTDDGAGALDIGEKLTGRSSLSLVEVF